MTITRLEKLLKSATSGRLGKVIQTAQDMQTLTAALREPLDPELAAGLVAASVRDGELSVLADSPAWASRLRFEADTLLAAARAAGAEVSRCRVRVARGGDAQA